MELESAVRRRLLADATVTGYVGDRVYLHRLEDRVDPVGLRAIVLYAGPWWGESERYVAASAEYPTLVVDCWADCTRTGDGDVARLDRVQNAKAVWRAVHRLLHNPPRGEVWGEVGSNPGLLVNTSTLWFAPSALEGAEVRRTGTPLQDAAVVSGTYAMNTAVLTG
jgi:hypothetical protein